MPLLRSTAEALLESLLQGSAMSQLETQFQYAIGQRVSAAESRSWMASLPVLAQDLRDAGLSSVETLVEHRLPMSSKRADVVLCGNHPATG